MVDDPARVQSESTRAASELLNSFYTETGRGAAAFWSVTDWKTEKWNRKLIRNSWHSIWAFFGGCVGGFPLMKEQSFYCP